MAENEDITTGIEGAAPNTGEGQVADQTTQEAGQGQNIPQEGVGTPEQTSSDGSQGGKQRGRWSTERLVERALEKKLGPLMERLDSLSTPAAPQKTPTEELGQPNYDNLTEWLNTAVDKLVDNKMGKTLPGKLDEFKGELRSVSKTQEARNYLSSQEDIGDDEDKKAEIMEIMKANLWDFAAEHRPLQSVKLAVNAWRKGRVNPNAPTKQMLSTISGGTGITGGSKEPTIEEMRALGLKIANNPTMEEKEKLHQQVDSLFNQG